MSVKTSIAPRRLTQGFFAFLLLSERLNVITAHLSCFRYECIVHPDFYQQLGTDIPAAINAGVEIVTQIYG